MSDDFEVLNFEAADDAAEDGDGLVLDIDGYEGPLHLLLELAQKQKVDLARISILELAEQYLNFIKHANDLRIELAADYLVMASWLAYLKSRLILPRADEDAPPEEDELAAHLAFRLQRLEAMRRASRAFFKLPQFGQNIFGRGAPEGLCSRTSPLYEAELFDILKAYGAARSKEVILHREYPKPRVLPLEEARSRLQRAIMALGVGTEDWVALDGLLPESGEFHDNPPRQSIRASSLLAGLELAKEGEMEMRQTGAFTPIYVRGGQEKTKKEAS